MNYLFLSLSSKLKRLQEEILSQISFLLKNQNIKVETRWIPALNLLHKKSMSVQELATSLMISHPAVVQLLKQLMEEGYVKGIKSSADKRVTYSELTEKGKKEFGKTIPLLDAIDKSLNSLASQTGYDAEDVLSKLHGSIGSNQLFESINNSLKEDQLSKIKIVTYGKKFKEDFKNLNYEWLEKYFVVEPTDKKMLESPEKEIIKKGGEIFFALLNDEVVGTCAVLKIDKSTYEIAKMAVAEKAQGKQVGRKLGLTVIGFAVSKKAGKIVLDTNSKLVEATNLYRKLGFVTVPYDYDDRYERELIRMELNLRGI